MKSLLIFITLICCQSALAGEKLFNLVCYNSRGLVAVATQTDASQYPASYFSTSEMQFNGGPDQIAPFEVRVYQGISLSSTSSAKSIVAQLEGSSPLFVENALGHRMVNEVYVLWNGTNGKMSKSMVAGQGTHGRVEDKDRSIHMTEGGDLNCTSGDIKKNEIHFAGDLQEVDYADYDDGYTTT